MENYFTGKKLKGSIGIQILFFTAFFFFGLFKEYAACIYTGLLCCFFFAAFRKCDARIFIGTKSLMVFTAVLMYLIAVLWSVDFGMSAVGAVRMAGVLVFALITMQLDDQQRKKLFLCIPAAGVIMTLTGAAAFPLPVLRRFFWTDSRRLGGFFQYPNVFALFCLLGFLVLAELRDEDTGRKKEWVRTVFMLILLSGILLSGSRSVFFLTAGAVFLAAVFDKKCRKKMAAIALLSALLAVGYVTLSGNMLNIGRFLTASFSSSTLLGRLIYVQDAALLLWRYPFGMGYLGYYYMEPKIQTAVYSVRFVHNDILQIALDIGVLPCLFFVVVFVKTIYEKRHSFYECLMLIVMGLHLFLDFDLEFISMWYALVLLLCPMQGKEITIHSGRIKRTVSAAVLVCGMISVYFGAAMLPRYLGNPDLSLSALPFYTEAGKEVLAAKEDMDAAADLADKLMAQNAYIAEAYDIKALEAYQKQMYGKMLSCKKQSLVLQKYDMDAYNRYIALLGQAVLGAAESGDEDAVMDILYAIVETEDILEEVKEQTNPLAYQTRDVPELTLSSQAVEYIAKVKEILEE